MWPILRTMMIIETEPLRNPIGFVHFKQRDERFAFIDKVVADHAARKIGPSRA